ncbi:MAG: hypothetical protein DRI73_00780 [Bacteroidetes bacterium]|nr:MAG: hypothetical protein DRI73_00780 [Bacteroidota bacterium]
MKQEKHSNQAKKHLKPPTQKPHLYNYARFSGLAFQMGIIIFAGVYGGIKLDEKVKWETPVFTIVLSLLSVIISLYIVLKDFIKK